MGATFEAAASTIASPTSWPRLAWPSSGSSTRCLRPAAGSRAGTPRPRQHERPPLPRATDWGPHTYQSYVVLLDASLDRDAVIEELRGQGIESTLKPTPSTRSPTSRALRMRPGPPTHSAHSVILALPMHAGLTEGDVEFVAACLRARRSVAVRRVADRRGLAELTERRLQLRLVADLQRRDATFLITAATISRTRRPAGPPRGDSGPRSDRPSRAQGARPEGDAGSGARLPRPPSPPRSVERRSRAGPGGLGLLARRRTAAASWSGWHISTGTVRVRNGRAISPSRSCRRLLASCRAASAAKADIGTSEYSWSITKWHACNSSCTCQLGTFRISTSSSCRPSATRRSTVARTSSEPRTAGFDE